MSFPLPGCSTKLTPMPPLDWSNLRPLDGSQQNAFEELCCQLLRAEPVAGSATVVRKGRPDAGVEIYRRLPDGEEYGLQAKFFRQSPNAGQWAQIDKSVRIALEKHPRLTHYRVCLPLDRSDGRIDGTESMMDKWNTRVEKWEGWAAERGITVNFDYVGESELIGFLSRDSNRGRVRFWFGGTAFSEEWFRRRAAEKIAALKGRYLPAAHIDVRGVEHLIDGLVLGGGFYRIVEGRRDVLLDTSVGLCFADVPSGAEPAAEALRRAADEVTAELQCVLADRGSEDEFESAWANLRDLCGTCHERAGRYSTEIQRAFDEVAPDDAHNRLRSAEVQLSHLSAALFAAVNLPEEFAAATGRVAVLCGEAGSGKSHAFGRIADVRTRAGLPTVLLLGNEFRLGTVWGAAAEQLGLGDCELDEFLAALDAAAETGRCRALLLIDALNESDGRKQWATQLPQLVAAVRRYPRVALAVSVRSSYRDFVLGEGEVARDVVEREHPGFSGDRREAARSLFRHYGVTPDAPPLEPEFDNPLFVHLFCRAAVAAGGRLSNVPCLSDAVRLILDAVDEALSGEGLLGTDPRSRVVNRAAAALSARMAESHARNFLRREEAESVLNGLLPRDRYPDSLLFHLISQGVLREDVFYGGVEPVEVVSFQYERHGDLLIAEQLVDGAGGVAGVRRSLDGGRLRELLDDGPAFERSGLLEALCVAVPERLGAELHELAPHLRDRPGARAAFLNSLVWRRRDVVGEDAVGLTDELVAAAVADGSTAYAVQRRDEVLDTLVRVSASETHPFNGDYLHRVLWALPMAERDTVWSTFLHRRHRRGTGDDPLIEWALAEDPHERSREAVARLVLETLGWYLTTPCRPVRDRATMALVNLCDGRSDRVLFLLARFAGVDDPYVAERIHAVACGVALRSDDPHFAGVLAEAVFGRVFATDHPPAHLLLRDYARGVVERAVHLGAALTFDPAAARPPHRSEWSDEEAARLPAWHEFETAHDPQAFGSLYASLEWGDFATYTLGPYGGGARAWTAAPHPPEESNAARSTADLPPGFAARFDEIDPADPDGLEKLLAVLDSLTDAEREVHEAAVQRSGEEVAEEERAHRLPEDFAPRWIFRRVLELGWTPERFGEFDGGSRYGEFGDGRLDTRRPERMGKKYQWIAFHELLARVTDHRPYRHEYGRTVRYDTPCDTGFQRDIDPTCPLIGTRSRRDPSPPGWWVGEDHAGNFGRPGDADAWIADASDVPRDEPHLLTTDPHGTRWLSLDSFRSWHSDDRLPSGGTVRREVWLMVRGYLLPKEHAEAALQWATGQDFFGRWMPEPRPLGTDLFLRELYWSPAYRGAIDPAETPGVQGETNAGTDRPFPCPLLVTASEFLWEASGGDCSVEESISIRVPGPKLAGDLSLRCGGVDGTFVDRSGTVAAQDPSAVGGGPGALLLRRDVAERYLAENDSGLLWTVIGEKHAYFTGGGASGPAARHWLSISGAYLLTPAGPDGVRDPSLNRYHG